MTGRYALTRPVIHGAGFLLSLLSLSMPAGCGGGRELQVPPGDEVVATWTGGRVLRSEFDRYPREKLAGAEAQATDPAQDWRVRIIRDIAVRKILAAETAEDDPEVAAAVRAARDGVLRDAAYRVLGLAQTAVPGQELRQYYDSHSARFQDVEKLRLQQIFFRAEEAELAESEREAARQRLEAIRREILAGADFTAMAQQHSESATRHSGGWILLKRNSDVFPQVMDEVWGLKIDEVSEVVATPIGFHLFKLKERIAPVERSFEEVREFVGQSLQAEKTLAREQEFVAATGPCYGLVKDYERLGDPFIDDTEPLIYLDDRVFTFAELQSVVPERTVEQLFNGYLPEIEETLDRVALELLLVREAERLGLEARPEVAQAIEDAVAEARSEIALQRRLLAKVAEVDEETLRAYFWQNEQRYKTLLRFDLSVILLPRGDEPLFATLKRGEALADRIRAGEDFGALARQYSRHYSASHDGVMRGLADRDIANFVQSSGKFRRMLKELEVGEIGVMVAECYSTRELKYIQTGVIVIRKDGVVEPVQSPFETVKELVRSNYRRRHYTELAAEVRQSLQESSGLTIVDAALPPL